MVCKPEIKKRVGRPRRGLQGVRNFKEMGAWIVDWFQVAPARVHGLAIVKPVPFISDRHNLSLKIDLNIILSSPFRCFRLFSNAANVRNYK